MSLLGVDISEYQGRPDWRRARAAGVVFAIAKATEGASHVDRSYGYNRDAIRAAGIVPGAYHFLVATSAAAAQADAFCRVADPAAVHALDVEAHAQLDVAGWVARYRHHYPRHPLVIYTGRDFWARSVRGPGAAYGPLWAAGYRPNAYVPGSGSLAGLAAKVGANRSGLPWGGWSSAVMLQFTDKASVPGIAGPVDGDVFFGTIEQLRVLVTGTAGTITAPPTPHPEDDMPTAREIVDEFLNTPVPTGELGSDKKPLTFAWMLVRSYQADTRTTPALAALTDAVNDLTAEVVKLQERVAGGQS